ncbi:MAG: hypothetical protein NC548_13885 [Lachnospiraceae bacterium]|nr:hypothetical protein [Lachnospiraceae bacterium]MCM1215595.1 hypothetical protein [Lachnospiraceae bacterium]
MKEISYAYFNTERNLFPPPARLYYDPEQALSIAGAACTAFPSPSEYAVALPHAAEFGSAAALSCAAENRRRCKPCLPQVLLEPL